MNTTDNTLREFARYIPGWGDMDRFELYAVRTSFAAAVIDIIADCKNNAEALHRLSLAMNPQYGFRPPYVLGAGSTRRAWELPFGLALKLERTDPLPIEEMTYRGSRHYLNGR